MDTAKRLLVLCHGFPPYYGGAEHAAYDLAREAVQAGHAVTVLTSDIGGRLPAEEEMEGMRIIRLHARKKEWSFHTTFELLDFLRVALKHIPSLIKEVQPDFIWAHFSVPAGLVAFKASRKFGTPYGVVLHGSDVPGYQSGRFGLIYPALRLVVRRIWQRAAFVVAVSDELRSLALNTWPAGTIDVIPNGVDTERFKPDSAQEAGAGPELQALVAAQWIERKGIHFLLEAIHGLDPQVKKRLVWHLCGSGPYEPQLRRLIHDYQLEDRVHLHGLIARDNLTARLCKETDLFVLPSLQEGLPLALLEALSAGTAVIATRVGGIPSALTDGKDALLCDPASPEQLRVAIERLVKEPRLRQTLQEQARQTALRYSWNASWLHYEHRMNRLPLKEHTS